MLLTFPVSVVKRIQAKKENCVGNSVENYSTSPIIHRHSGTDLI